MSMKKRTRKTAPAAKQTAAATKAAAEKRPGVIASIVEAISTAKGATAEEIHAGLVKKFPERDPKGMRSTVRIQANRNAARKEKIEGRGLVYYGKKK
jgi:hypothetical protein